MISKTQADWNLPSNSRGFPGAFRVLERFSFWALIVLMPFRLRTVVRVVPFDGIFPDFTNWLLYASDIPLGLLLFSWIFRKILERTGIQRGPWFLFFPMLALFGIGLVSSLDSIAPEISFFHLLRLGIMVVFYLYLVNEIRSLKEVFLPIAVQVAIQSVVGVAQFIRQGSIGLQVLGEWPLSLGWEGISIVWAPGFLALRSYGLTDHSNILGGLLVFGVIFLTAGYLRPQIPRLPILFAVLTLGLAGILLSFSRAAWLALIAAGILVALSLWGHRKHRLLVRVGKAGLAAGLVLLPVLIAVLPYLGSRLTVTQERLVAQPDLLSPEERSIIERSALAAAGSQIFSANPITGVGLGVFPIALQAHSPEFPFQYQPVHFLPLEIAAETGLFGALFYFLLALCPLVGLWTNRRRLHFSPGLNVTSAALAASLVIAFLDYYLWLHPSGRLWQWFIWGTWAAFYQRNGVDE